MTLCIVGCARTTFSSVARGTWFVSGSAVSASAVHIESASRLAGHYIFTHLSSRAAFPVISDSYKVSIIGNRIYLTDAAGRRCEPWTMVSLSHEGMKIRVGLQVILFSRAHHSTYEEYVDELGRFAAGLSGRAVAVPDALKPVCLGRAFHDDR